MPIPKGVLFLEAADHRATRRQTEIPVGMIPESVTAHQRRERSLAALVL
jgi:hypothetical protein